MTRFKVVAICLLLGALPALGQVDPVPSSEKPPAGLKQREEPPPGRVLVPKGTRVPLVLINSVSTKHAAPGDRIYLESIYPVVVEGKILIPPGTYVSGSVTQVKRPGRVKGKGELFLRFEQLILPNGTIRDLAGHVGALDGRSPEGFDREEGKITSEGNKSGDAATVAKTTTAGASIGAIAGAAGGRAGMGVGIGAAAGAAAGLAGVLATRGPDAILEKGTQLDMVIDRELFFTPQEVTFRNPLARPGGQGNDGEGPNPDRNRSNGNGGGFGNFPPF
jgi:type IV secretion system protein VirB10